jgi:protein phosphatase
VTIDLPDPCLVVLIGPAGSGKSTLAARLLRPTEIVSSDACRAVVADDFRARDADTDAFALVHRIVAIRLRRGLTVAVDATNVHRRSRRTLLGLARTHGRPALAVVLDLPEALCVERDRARGDSAVGAGVVRAHRRLLDGTLRGLDAEGFAQVVTLRTQDEVDSFQVVRAPASTPETG